MTIAIDGSATTSSSDTVTLSTTSANDVIMCYIESVLAVTSISDTAGLTWIKRVANPILSGGINFSEWYAISSGVLTNDVITQSPSQPTGRIVAFGLSGANTSSPFDSNGSIPNFVALGDITSTSDAITYSTNNANDIILEAFRSASAPGTITRPSGFTQVLATGGSQDHCYRVVSATQSSVTDTYSYTNMTASMMIVDAIKAASTNVTTPYYYTMLGNV